MFTLKQECDTIGQKRSLRTKKGRHGESPKRRPTESNEQTKHILAQYSERYHKLRKAIAQKKESIRRSHKADWPYKSKERNEVLPEYEMKPSNTTG